MYQHVYTFQKDKTISNAIKISLERREHHKIIRDETLSTVYIQARRIRYEQIQHNKPKNNKSQVGKCLINSINIH